VRRAVCDVLLAVEERGAYANLLLPSVLRERRVTGRDAALATELCYGTLRGQGTYDAVLSVCSDRGIAKMDPPVRQVLRLGVHQLLGTRIAAHAAVTTSVDLAKDVAGPRPAGFVNAVLRRVATRNLDDWLAVVAPDREADPAGYLTVRHSYPDWIVDAFREALGEAPGGDLAETEAALAAGNVAPRVTLCAIPGRCEPGELLAAADAEPAKLSPFGVYLAQGDPGAIRAVSERRATVQDEASQLVALAVASAEVTGPDGLWLDMCAGPGGKAGLLAGLAAGRGARLVASDAREHRAAMARDALAGSAAGVGSAPGSGSGRAPGSGSAPGPGSGRATGPGSAPGPGSGRATGPGSAPGSAPGPGSITGTLVADGTAPGWRAGVFDRVLADVPCSGLGSLRRRPESRWRRSPGQVAELAGLQRRLLAAAIDSARPGGVIGYVTCTPHLAETREVLAGVLRDRQDVEVLDAPALLPDVPGLGCAAPFGKYIQFWPHRHGTDAIFLAVLRRLLPGQRAARGSVDAGRAHVGALALAVPVAVAGAGVGDPHLAGHRVGLGAFIPHHHRPVGQNHLGALAGHRLVPHGRRSAFLGLAHPGDDRGGVAQQPAAPVGPDAAGGCRNVGRYQAVRHLDQQRRVQDLGAFQVRRVAEHVDAGAVAGARQLHAGAADR
jgi:16S rRNA (cytosine967-C5)-methyltransferase